MEGIDGQLVVRAVKRGAGGHGSLSMEVIAT
jgi:hypothetical protein